MGYMDYIILGVYLVAVTVLGIFSRQKERTRTDFYLAGRSMGWIPIGLSVMVTAFSVVNYMAIPTEVFANGSYVLISLPIFFLSAFLVSRLWLPRLYRMQLSSVYSFFQERFDSRVRILASSVFIIWRVFWMATALYAAGMLLSKISHTNIYLIILIAGLAATLYTGIGGMRAVMWTDCLQFAVLFGGIIIALVLVLAAQGWDDFFATAAGDGKFMPFYPFDPGFFSLDPHLRIGFFSGVIGVTVAFLTRYGADQVVVQRYLTARSLADAQRGIWLNAAAAFIALLLLALFGVAIYVKAVAAGVVPAGGLNLTPVAQRKLLAVQQLVAAISNLPAGVYGLVVSGLLAATMSSIDSGINACSNAWENDIHPLFTGKAATATGLGRYSTLGFGIICTLLGLLLVPLVGYTKSLFVIVNQIVNALGSPLLALFIAGIYCRGVTAAGAFWGGVCGFVFSVLFSLTYNGLALHYYAVVNLIVTLFCIITVSMVYKIIRGDTVFK